MAANTRRRSCCCRFLDWCYSDLEVVNNDVEDLWFNEPRVCLRSWPFLLAFCRVVSTIGYTLAIVLPFFSTEELYRAYLPYLTRVNVIIGFLFYILLFYRDRRLYQQACAISLLRDHEDQIQETAYRASVLTGSASNAPGQQGRQHSSGMNFLRASQAIPLTSSIKSLQDAEELLLSEEGVRQRTASELLQSGGTMARRSSQVAPAFQDEGDHATATAADATSNVLLPRSFNHVRIHQQGSSNLTRVMRLLQEWIVVMSLMIFGFYWLLIYSPANFAPVGTNADQVREQQTDPSRSPLDAMMATRVTWQDLRLLEAQERWINTAAFYQAEANFGARVPPIDFQKSNYSQPVQPNFLPDRSSSTSAARLPADFTTVASFSAVEARAPLLLDEHNPMLDPENDLTQAQRREIVDRERTEAAKVAQEYANNEDADRQLSPTPTGSSFRAVGSTKQERYPTAYKLYRLGKSMKSLEFWICLFEHALILFAATTELCLFQHRFLTGRLVLLLFLALTWLATNIAYTLALRTPLYAMLDWGTNVGKALAYVGAVLLFLTLVYYALLCAHRSRCLSASPYYPRLTGSSGVPAGAGDEEDQGLLDESEKEETY
ncbi:unnamed protein product [Amoebophrya sp. A120]|nr:unnamed protein product [Amoebophrya sp. A120]|eukprot:GSA120T00021527001.1